MRSTTIVPALLSLGLCFYAGACGSAVPAVDSGAPQNALYGGAGAPLSQSDGSRSPVATLTTTSVDGKLQLASWGGMPLRRGADNRNNRVILNVDSDVTYQTMDGFGASLTDSSAWLLWHALSEQQRHAVVRELFSPSDGLGISLLRQPMGATGFTVNGDFSYDDMPQSKSDDNLEHFSVAHDEAYIIPLLQEALALNADIHLFALPWSAPAWMKTKDSMKGGALKPMYYAAMAQYFVRFVQAYGAHNLPVYAVSAQNAPADGDPDHPASVFSATAEARFIGRDLGPALRAANLPVKILGSEQSWGELGYPADVLASTAAPYLAGTAVHCDAAAASQQERLRAAYPTKDIWLTECTQPTEGPSSSDAEAARWTSLLESLRAWSRSVVLGSLALDQHGGPTNGGCHNCRGVLTIDTKTVPATVVRNGDYYMLAHLARYVQPGARRVESDDLQDHTIHNVAFRNPDGSLVAVVFNGANRTVPLTITWNGYALNHDLVAESLNTFVWNGVDVVSPTTDTRQPTF